MSSARSTPETLPPIFTAALLRPLDTLLVQLLGQLDASDWDRPTLAPQWKVKDVAAHLLDGHLRKLSIVRDSFVTQRPRDFTPAAVASFVNRLNAEGVAYYSRLSPRLLVTLFEAAAAEFAQFHESLDPFAPAQFPVSWAGEAASLNWFDTARELTECWHHQQQIRTAVNRPGILTPQFYHPVLDTFLRALPHNYRHVPAETGSLIEVDIEGDCGGTWHLFRQQDSWTLLTAPQGHPIARIAIPQQIAWRLFTKGIDRATAAKQITIDGDPPLAEPLIAMTAIVA